MVAELRRAAEEKGAPFHYAPDLADEAEIPASFSLAGSFNRENAVTAIAALKTLGIAIDAASFGRIVWPGRFQRVGDFLIDGAHNPPAAKALAEALRELFGSPAPRAMTLVFGACGDKDVETVLCELAPFVRRAFAVRTNNPRSLVPEVLAAKMRATGLEATPCGSLKEALENAGDDAPASKTAGDDAPVSKTLPRVLVCGSLFLVGEALVELGAAPWQSSRFDPSEHLAGNL